MAAGWTTYVDFIVTKGTELSRFLNYNRSGPVCCSDSTANGGSGNSMAYTGKPWLPQLDEVMVATSLGHSLYRGLTLGLRKRFSDKYSLEANYVFAKDEDDDSNERDPFTIAASTSSIWTRTMVRRIATCGTGSTCSPTSSSGGSSS
jgi:hypothetical protein